MLASTPATARPTPQPARPRIAAWAEAPLAWRMAAPFGIAAAVAAAVFVLLNQHWIGSVKLVLGYVFTPVGKEAWFVAGETQLRLPWWLILGLLWAVEASISLFFALVVSVERLLERLPRVGRRVRRWEQRIHASRSAQYGLGTALAVLVALPIHSGGAILGPIVGRSLGLWWHQAYIAVMAGTTVRLAAVAGIVAGLLSWLG